jgi:hypothetical protein
MLAVSRAEHAGIKHSGTTVEHQTLLVAFPFIIPYQFTPGE